MDWQRVTKNCGVKRFIFLLNTNPLRQSAVMKCAAHNSEAVGICVYCGRALCGDCAKPGTTGRMTCSENCATALAHNETALQLILQKSVQGSRASAFYLYLCAGLSLAAAIGAHFYLPSPFLIWFCAGCAVVFIASGIWHGKISRGQNP
jgi:hypothetical protein